MYALVGIGHIHVHVCMCIHVVYAVPIHQGLGLPHMCVLKGNRLQAAQMWYVGGDTYLYTYPSIHDGYAHSQAFSSALHACTCI